MRSEILLAVISKMVGEHISSLQDNISARRGPRGPSGTPGENGIDGKSFVWEDHAESIKELIQSSALKFNDLTEEQISSLRGPKGRDGKDGTDGTSFEFSNHREEIVEIVYRELKSMSSDLKIKFSDLSSEELDSLRGPRGQRGKPGKDFVFDEHLSFFEGLKFKFQDFLPEELEQLKLKFSHLTSDDIDNLKLKFSDLSAEEISLIRGPRGQRGKSGTDGKDGTDGKSLRGPIGPVGLTGPRGYEGVSGPQGLAGAPAPSIIDFEIKEYPKGEIALRITLSDGSILETNKISLPQSNNVTQIAIGIGGSTGSSVAPVEQLDYLVIPQLLTIRSGGSYTIVSSSGTRVFEPASPSGRGLVVRNSVSARAGGQLVIESGSSATALGA
jgi:hypothetical protein